jgi:hypothetical protein
MNKTLILDLELYPERLIEKAIRNYREIAEITCTRNGEFAEMLFKNCVYDEERTLREFENHLIELCNIRHRL